MTRQLREASNPNALWRFAVPVALGSLAGGGAAFVVRRCMKRDPNLTRDAAIAVAHTVGFWLVGGAAWIYLSKRPEALQ